MPDYQLPKRRRIYVMRHGDVTYFDATGRAIDPETVPLNASGRDQASAAGHAFAAQQIRFDRVIVSGLPRTIETAQRVLAETHQHIELEIDPALQEIRGGKLGSIPAADIEAAFLTVFDGVVPESTRFLGGETIGELFDRVLPAIAALRDDTSWDTVLLVLHGGVNRAILSHATRAARRRICRAAHARAVQGRPVQSDLQADHAVALVRDALEARARSRSCCRPRMRSNASTA
jgi:broad specificity phosphatase PhoE